MDFLNTRPTPRSAPIELIGDGTSYAAWLEGVRLPPRPGTYGEWARDWIARWRDAPGGAYRAELRRLNHLMARASCYPELVITKDGFQVTERWRIDSADELIAVVAAEIASLVATEEPALVKCCAGPGCALWFVDRKLSPERPADCGALTRGTNPKRTVGRY